MTTLSLILAIALGAEPFRFEPLPDNVPLPIPIVTPPSDQAGNARQEVHAPADPRPKIFVHTVHRKGLNASRLPPLCQPCETFAEWWLANCDTYPLNVEPVEYESFDALPQWVREKGVPLVQFPSKKQPTGWACSTWEPAKIVRLFDEANPAAPLTGASPFDQVHKFTGPGGKFTFTPDAPINTALDDRTSLRFQSIQGRYTVRDGKVELKLEPPLPTGEYRKWLRFGFQITGGGGPENVTATTADVRIDTNRGPQRITVTMEPQKP